MVLEKISDNSDKIGTFEEQMKKHKNTVWNEDGIPNVLWDNLEIKNDCIC